MANTKSAIKRMRQSVVRNAHNTSIRSSVKTAMKKVREAVARGDHAEATELLARATRTIDKASARGVIKGKGAARRVSRLAKAVHGTAAQQ